VAVAKLKSLVLTPLRDKISSAILVNSYNECSDGVTTGTIHRLEL